MSDRATTFRRLHAEDTPIVLPNAWDAGSARVIESAGARAVATTSAGLAWSCGYPDGDTLPPDVLAHAVGAIARVVAVPLTVDVEGGYSSEPDAVAATVVRVARAGAVGINLEDGAGDPALLAAKIAAVKAAAKLAGVDVFVNARTDVYLRGLVPPAAAVDETVARAQRYAAAGCDGIFVPGLTDADTIRTLAAAIALPLNVMVSPGLPPVATLGTLGVRRVSAGSGLAQAAYAVARRAAVQLIADGQYDALAERTLGYGELNALFGRT